MDDGVGVHHEAVDLVADGVAGHVGADLLDGAGVVAAQDHRELVLDHVLEHAGGDGVVDRVGRRGTHPYEDLVRSWRKSRLVVAQRGHRGEVVKDDGFHI